MQCFQQQRRKERLVKSPPAERFPVLPRQSLIYKSVHFHFPFLDENPPNPGPYAPEFDGYKLDISFGSDVLATTFQEGEQTGSLYQNTTASGIG